MLCCSAEELFADFDSADSPQFYVNLLTERGAPSFDSSDSPTFALDLLGIRRVWADSDSFSFDWLANSQPSQGPLRPPPSCPPDDLLEQYDSVNNRWIAASTFPAIGQSVIVLNFGWNSEPNTLLDLASAISNRIPGIYIYTWDWSYFPNDTKGDANPNDKSTSEDFALIKECLIPIVRYECLFVDGKFRDELMKTKTNAAKHGVRLGDSLLAHGIRPDLHKIHLIGSSYGGVVCAEAAKMLAKSGSKVQQITTLDTPAVYVHAVKEYIEPEFAERVEVLYYDWHTCLAGGGTGGPVKTNESNVFNLKLNPHHYPLPSDFPLHFRVSDWYEESIINSNSICENEYGFGWSVSLNPTGWHWDDWPLGNEEETRDGKGCLTSIVDLIAEDVMKAGDKVKDTFDSAKTFFGNNALLIIDKIKNSSVKLFPPEEVQQSQYEIFTFAKMDLLTDTNDSYIYKEVNIPPGSDEIALDVRFSAVGEGDKLTVSVGDEILIVIDAYASGVSDIYQTYYASVSDYAGQTAIVQIALRLSGTGQTVALIDNLRFTQLTLVEDITGDKVIDTVDLEVLADNWLVVGCDYREHCEGADIDRNNKVDFTDFARLASYWLESF